MNNRSFESLSVKTMSVLEGTKITFQKISTPPAEPLIPKIRRPPGEIRVNPKEQLKFSFNLFI